MTFTPKITTSEKFLDLCVETSAYFSRELTEEEVRQALKNGKLSQVLKRLWEFTGHFYKWPEVLLQKSELPQLVKDDLNANLQSELGIDTGKPHTVLFANMAQSIGISLPSDTEPGVFMKQVLADAIELSEARAIGQFFANEATPKWAGFLAVFGKQPGVDLEFFEVHHDEDSHYPALLKGFTSLLRTVGGERRNGGSVF